MLSARGLCVPRGSGQRHAAERRHGRHARPRRPRRQRRAPRSDGRPGNVRFEVRRAAPAVALP